ncbi:MAG TPA: sulfatase [Chloroflexota bacterium]|nr:sulfatase [Chloroflexota bacterium]
MTQDRPNVLYIHSHDTGRYSQPYGHAIPMPAYQRFAEQGVLFRQNFCANPTCSPSRAALLTGQYPHSCGQLGLAHRGFELQHRERHLAWALRNAGYSTTLIGVQHVVKNEPERIATTGYEHITTGGKAAQVLPAALAFFENVPQDKPFFLDVGFSETHRVFHEADPSLSPAEDARYCLPAAPLPDTPETRKDMADFKASARVLDAAVGQILGALEAKGLAENTLVILTTDHGIAFPEMKCNLTDHGIGVLLMLRGPGGLSGGKVVDAPVSHLDVFPTVCAVAGITPPGWLQGKSLVPLVSGEVTEIHEAIFAEVNYHAAYEPQRAVRTPRWKYIRRYDTYRTTVLPNCDNGYSKDVWLQHGWAERECAPEQLYDLIFDPVERNNLADDPRYSGVLEEMRERLLGWMRATDDPLLDGPVPVPEGAVVTPQEALAPR